MIVTIVPCHLIHKKDTHIAMYGIDVPTCPVVVNGDNFLRINGNMRDYMQTLEESMYKCNYVL